MEVNSKYFLLSPKHEAKIASAFVLTDNEYDHNLIQQLEGKTTAPFDFELKLVTETADGIIVSKDVSKVIDIWRDYQPNNLAWPLFSAKLKSVIESNLTNQEGVDWIKCYIKGPNERRTYYILRFNKIFDVLDIKNTIFVQGTDHLIKPCFSYHKIKQFQIFTTPFTNNLWKITPGIYISNYLKMNIQKEKIKGVSFEQTLVK